MKKVINLLLFTLFYVGNMFGCVLTIHNDSGVKVTLVPHGQDLNDKEKIVNIEPKETKKFGEEHEKADFFLYMELQDGNSVKMSRVQQKACLHGFKEEVVLNVSGLTEPEKFPLADPEKFPQKLTDFFEVTKLQDYPTTKQRSLEYTIYRPLKRDQRTGLVPPLQMPDKFEPYPDSPFNK